LCRRYPYFSPLSSLLIDFHYHPAITMNTYVLKYFHKYVNLIKNALLEGKGTTMFTCVPITSGYAKLICATLSHFSSALWCTVLFAEVEGGA
jgi:hypothetical protein